MHSALRSIVFLEIVLIYALQLTHEQNRNHTDQADPSGETGIRGGG